jgi:hypothetical protein
MLHALLKDAAQSDVAFEMLYAQHCGGTDESQHVCCSMVMIMISIENESRCI